MGPLWDVHSSIGGLLVGRSSAGLKGLIVIPGIIDADFTGQICIMAYTLHPPMTVPQGSRIAQIVILSNAHPELKTEHENEPNRPIRGDRGFGSTGAAVCFTMTLGERPVQSVTLQHNGQQRTIQALVDTGADVTIVAAAIWPREWPTCSPPGQIEGVGGQTAPLMSVNPIQICSAEGQIANTRVYVISLPQSVSALLGRDCLAQWGAIITTDHRPFY